MTVVLILVMLLVPPPLGQVLGTLVLGSALTVPHQTTSPPPAPQPDCNCGVPDSPRGPR